MRRDTRLLTGLLLPLLVAAAPAPTGPGGQDQALSGHVRLALFWEVGTNDHNHRSNIDGTQFEANSRMIVFSIATDLPIAGVPKASEIRCAAHREGDGNNVTPFEVMTEEDGPKVSIVGQAGSDKPGWARGHYEFACITSHGLILLHSFTVG